jgi:hypothetical protein
MAKKTLPPALKENADRLKRGEALHSSKPSGKAASTSQRPKIRSKQKKG